LIQVDYSGPKHTYLLAG